MRFEQLASAFELTLAEVHRDWALVHGAGGAQYNDLVEQLRLLYGWDASVAPYYVKWLRRSDECR